jgi:hypothetical protein
MGIFVMKPLTRSLLWPTLGFAWPPSGLASRLLGLAGFLGRGGLWITEASATEVPCKQVFCSHASATEGSLGLSRSSLGPWECPVGTGVRLLWLRRLDLSFAIPCSSSRLVVVESNSNIAEDFVSLQHLLEIAVVVRIASLVGVILECELVVATLQQGSIARAIPGDSVFASTLMFLCKLAELLTRGWHSSPC